MALEDHASGLGDLFSYLWTQVAPHVNVLYSRPWSGRDRTESRTLRRLLEGPGDRIHDRVLDYLSGHPRFGTRTSVAATALPERAFVVMVLIDDLADRIHPGSVATTRRYASPVASDLLERMVSDYAIFGHLGGGTNGCGQTIFKGPLFDRADRDPVDASGDRLDTQFNALTVVAPRMPHIEVSYGSVSPLHFPIGTTRNVSPLVGFAPIAEDADDLEFLVQRRGGRPFLDARPADADVLPARSVQAVAQLLRDGADIVVLPELCSHPSVVDLIALELARAPAPGNTEPKLVLLGSGLSAEICPATDLPYNEAVVVDGKGNELWRQRKLNHFKMSHQRMTQCGINSAIAEGHTENSSSGTRLEVRDLPGYGRVIVLICEDLEQEHPGGLTRELRPDWILTPVLDICQRLGRWTSQRAIELGRHVPTKVIVANSASLLVRDAKRRTLSEVEEERLGIGLCVDVAAGRRIRIVRPDMTSPATKLVRWDPGVWEQYELDTATPR